MRENKLTVYQPNSICGAEYALTLGEQRIIFLAISKSNKGVQLPRVHTIRAKEYSQQYGISEREAYDQLRRASKTLFDKQINIDNSEAEIDQRWITRRAVYKSGDIEFSLAPEIADQLENLRKEYTQYGLEKICGMTSPNAIRIFTMMMQFKSTGWIELSVDKLRSRLKLKNKYKQYGAFKHNVISPAIKQIILFANHEVQIKEIKTGRRVEKIRITFIEKPQKRLL